MRGTQRGNPTYDLAAIKDLVSRGQYTATKRVRGFILNHGYSVCDVIEGVVECAKPEGFHKSEKLSVMDGVYGDVYYVEFDEDTWYLKFCMGADGVALVTVLSCNLDGYVH